MDGAQSSWDRSEAISRTGRQASDLAPTRLPVRAKSAWSAACRRSRPGCHRRRSRDGTATRWESGCGRSLRPPRGRRWACRCARQLRVAHRLAIRYRGERMPPRRWKSRALRGQRQIEDVPRTLRSNRRVASRSHRARDAAFAPTRVARDGVLAARGSRSRARSIRRRDGQRPTGFRYAMEYYCAHAAVFQQTSTAYGCHGRQASRVRATRGP